METRPKLGLKIRKLDSKDQQANSPAVFMVPSTNYNPADPDQLTHTKNSGLYARSTKTNALKPIVEEKKTQV